MTQFASTLYPQTNPTNAILLEFREIHAGTGNSLWVDAYLFSSSLIEEWESRPMGQWHHALDVLTKIQSMFKEPISG